MARSKRSSRTSPPAVAGREPRSAAPDRSPRSAASLASLQRGAGNAAVGRLLGGLLVQAKLRSESSNEAPAPAESLPADPAQQPPADEPAGSSAVQEPAEAPAVVVDDAVDEVGAGQMKKSDFLARLGVAVTAAARTALAGTPHAGRAEGPIAMWLDACARQDVDRLNRDLRRAASDRPPPATAEEYIAVVAERVRTSVAAWATSGEITGIPPGMELPGLLPGGNATEGLATLASLGGVFFKARTGGPRDPGDPRAVRRELGEGRPLDGGVRARMEQALGRSFAHVRVHTEGSAPSLASRLDAKAFTVGEHIAFGAREYRPGTIAGDALLAHELAHVVQQGDGVARDLSPEGGAELEADADRSAASAVAALWGKTRGGLAVRPAPVSPPGLRLQRCAGCSGSTAAAPRQVASPAPDCSPPDAATWKQEVEAADKLQGAARREAMTTLVQRALCGTGLRVAVAGSRHTDRAHPDDYQKIPAVNFDPALNEKKAWVGDRKLSNNAGYSFNRGADEYVVLGPRVVDARSPLFARMYAEHELFHTEHHIGAGASQLPAADEELEAWTADFRRYFHQLYTFRMQWSPLVGYYEQASEAARRQSFERLVDYYNNPPVPEAEREAIRAAFGRWLRRRLSSTEHRGARLIQDLEARLHLGTESGAAP